MDASTDFRESSVATCYDAIEYTDGMLQQYHTWQEEHPEAPPCDLEPLVVLRAQARRLLSLIRAGELVPVGVFGRMGETLAEFDLAALQYKSDNLGNGGIVRTPEADRRYGCGEHRRA